MRYEFGTEGMSRSGRLCSLATLVEQEKRFQLGSGDPLSTRRLAALASAWTTNRQDKARANGLSPWRTPIALLWQQAAGSTNNSFFITPCREIALVWCFHWRNQTTDVNSDSTWSRQHFETQKRLWPYCNFRSTTRAILHASVALTVRQEMDVRRYNEISP